MTNDTELLTKAKQLDPAALRTLHQQYYEPVARYIKFKVGDPHTVEDLSGEVFVRILEGLKRGQSWRDSPQGWIMGIARNVVVDYYRKRERISEVELNEQVMSASHTDPTQRMLVKERLEHLHSALKQLTDEQRDVVLLRFIEGIDINSVAKAINKSPGAVKGLQYRALRALAEIMGDTTAESVAGTHQ